MKIEKKVRRFDLGELREATRTPQGFLFVPGFATRVGVFPYVDSNGQVRRELRHPDDVFDPESLKTLQHATVTIEHPPDMITPQNVAEYGVGHTTDRVEVNRDMVDCDLIVEKQDGIDAIEKEGIRELSCGYLSDIVEEEGVFNGTPYNFRQKNIRYNHLAMVKRGRAGPEIRIRMDSSDAVMQSDEMPQPKGSEFGQETSTDSDESMSTKKVVILGQEVDLPSVIADTVQDMLDRFDEMRAEVSQIKEQGMKTRKDSEINQSGISPQVNVEQMAPDGRKAPGKIGASDTGGVDSAKGDGDFSKAVNGMAKVAGKDADKDEKEDGEKEEGEKEDGEEKEDFEAPAGGAPAMSPADKLKKELEEAEALQKQHGQHVDGLRAKMDEMAAGSMNKPEAHPDRMDSMERKIEKRARQRAALERQASSVVSPSTLKKFDSMSDDEIRAAAISARHPSANVKGKSSHYLEARFDSMLESIEDQAAEDRRSTGRAVLGHGSERADSAEDINPDQARQRMVQSGREGYKSSLSANKK